MRRHGADEVCHTAKSGALPDSRLCKKKLTGLWRQRNASFAQILFPGVNPVEY